MRSVEIHLPYFKQGDDLAHFLEKCDTPQNALLAHAEMLMKAVQQLRDIADICHGKEISIDADTHHIGIDAEEDVITELLKYELVDTFDCDEDDIPF